ncbi:MAG TPA: molybdenum cofactor guanylyltransferase [Bacteroidales bacterium]|nr:molybdenum cofactor guanylyltransferase [Bacteroidales bacterium]
MTLIKEQYNVSAVLLAGGANKRFQGKIKANIQISGVRIITRTIKILHEIFDDIIIVTNTPDQFKGFNLYTLVPDQIKNVGPLGGIHAGIKAAKNDSVFVFASDMPCISSKLIKSQIEFYQKRRCDAAIPRINDFKEPLHAIYNTKIYEKLDDYLKNEHDYSIKNFLKTLNIRFHNLKDSQENRKSFININTPQDLSCMDLYAEAGYI